MRSRKLAVTTDHDRALAGDGQNLSADDPLLAPSQSGCSCVLDDAGHLILVSVAARALLGLGHSYKAGLHWLDAWPRENHTLLDHALDRAQSGESIEFSVYRTEASGRASWIRVAMRPAHSAAEPQHNLHVSLRDITAEKSAESQKYRFEM